MFGITSVQENANRTTLRSHLPPVRMATVNQQTSGGQRAWNSRDPCALSVAARIGAAAVENKTVSMGSPQTLTTKLLYTPAVSLQGAIYLEEMVSPP